MFRVITIGREFGCGSGEVAGKIAQRLGWKLMDRELIDEVARSAHVDPQVCRRHDERVEGWMHRIGKGLWLQTGEHGPATVPDEELDAGRMAELTRRVIEDVASAGECVIVGRGGNYILRDRRDAFHAFLYAHPAWRERHCGVAADEIARQDHARAAYIRRYFDEDWPDRHFYHVMVNAALGADTVASAILSAYGIS